MTASLIVAVPSKGRIQEESNAFFARSGLAIAKANARDYTGRLSGIAHAEVLFLSAGEIPAALESGQAHLGVTGADVIQERVADPDATVFKIKDLGFGRADLVVAVPRAWIDVSTMADLEEVAGAIRTRHHRHLRIATKYIRMTRAFFSKHGITDYRIVESAGATEGAPASGQADIIVDITSTGATLAANNLKILSDGVILKSQAQLLASRKAEWNDDTKRAVVDVFARIDANDMARNTIVLQFFYAGNIAKLHTRVKKELPQAELQAGVSCTEQTLYCADQYLYPALMLLRDMGVEGAIRTSRAEQIFVEGNALVFNFAKSIGGL